MWSVRIAAVGDCQADVSSGADERSVSLICDFPALSLTMSSSPKLGEIFQEASGIRCAHDCCMLVVHWGMLSKGLLLCGVGDAKVSRHWHRTRTVDLKCTKIFVSFEPSTCSVSFDAPDIPPDSCEIYPPPPFFRVFRCKPVYMLFCYLFVFGDEDNFVLFFCHLGDSPGGVIET